MKRLLLTLIVVFATSIYLTSLPTVSVFADHHEEGEHRHDDDFDIEEVERAIIDLERDIDEADEKDRRDVVRELRKEREELQEILDHHLDQSHDESHTDEHHGDRFQHFEERAHEMEMHRMEMELQRHEIELQGLRQEAAMRIAELAKDKTAFLTYAIQSVVLQSENPDQAVEILNTALGRTDEETIGRILRLQLLRVHQSVGNTDQAAEVLDALISDN